MNKLFKQVLEGAAFSQKEIARKLGVTESYISKIKRGQLPSVAFLRRLAKILGLDKDQLQALLDEAAVGRCRRAQDSRRLKLAVLADEPVILSADIQQMMRQVEEARGEVRQMSARLETVNRSLEAIGWLLLEALAGRK